MNKILITGATGFFGQSLIENISRNDNNNFEIYCVYNNSLDPKAPPRGAGTDNSEYLSDSKFKWLQCNLLDYNAAKKLISDIKPSHLIHLAWHVPPQSFWVAKENIDWLQASINIFREFCQNNGNYFICASTIAEYDWKSGILDEDTTQLKPNSLYGQCKKSLYDVITVIRDTHYPDTKIVWPRLGYFYGPNEPKNKLITKLIYHIKHNLPIDLAEPDLKKPYAHVKYFGEIIFKLIKSDINNDLVFNLSTSYSYTLKDIVNFIQKNLNNYNNDIINYNKYRSEQSLDVNTKILKSLNLDIPNVFYDDLNNLLAIIEQDELIAISDS